MERDLALGAPERLFQRNLQVVAQIRAALRASRALRSTGALRPEEHIEDVADALGGPEGPEAGSRRAAGRTDAPEAVVLATLLRIGEDLVGLVDLLEVRLGRRLVFGDVGMVFPREPTIGTLDVSLARSAFDAEQRVVIRGHVYRLSASAR